MDRSEKMKIQSFLVAMTTMMTARLGRIHDHPSVFARRIPTELPTPHPERRPGTGSMMMMFADMVVGCEFQPLLLLHHLIGSFFIHKTKKTFPVVVGRDVQGSSTHRRLFIRQNIDENRSRCY
jgi:hypothetical protein